MNRQRNTTIQENSRRDGFCGCRFCRGRGCLACDGESERMYKAQFPDGPKPILTVAVYSDPSDREGQRTMVDDGCPNTAEPYVIHPHDADRLLAAMEQGRER